MTEPFPSRAMRVAADCAGIEVATLRAPCRHRFVVRARWAVMVAMRKRGASYPQIARRLGIKCHSTVIHAIDMAPARARLEPEFARWCARVEAA